MLKQLWICRLDRCLPERELTQWFNLAAQQALKQLFLEVYALPEFVALLQQSSCIPQSVKQSDADLQSWLLQQQYSTKTDAGCLAMVGLSIELALERKIVQPMSMPELIIGQSTVMQCCIICHWWPVRLQHYHFSQSNKIICMDSLFADIDSQLFCQSIQAMAEEFNLPIKMLRSTERGLQVSEESMWDYWNI